MAENGGAKPYVAVPCNKRFEVRSASGRTIMVCSDAASAAHYALLLCEAYRSGYKAGLRDGKS